MSCRSPPAAPLSRCLHRTLPERPSNDPYGGDDRAFRAACDRHAGWLCDGRFRCSRALSDRRHADPDRHFAAGAAVGAICGTSTASAATLSATSLPAMLKQGYEPKMAAGVVAISGTLAMLIPPSVALVIYGLLAEVNIGALLIGGVIPGILVTITIMATVWFLAWQDPSRAPSAPAVSLREKFRMLRVVGPMLLLFGMVTGVIYTGVATPTEASALGAFGAFCLALS